MQPFYVTTPIYYPNDKPHIGTAYSTIAADVLTRYQRLRGRASRFLTGLDEHGLKIARAAEAQNVPPQAFTDRMQAPFREAWELLDCRYDDFIRTTEPRHKQRAQALWQRIQQTGDIYLGEYEDWYCVGCETFYTEKDLLEGNLCPQHLKPIERIKEQSYFFRLSKYQDVLLDYYEKHPDFVKPAGRFNEVKSFVREGLRDLSVSRTSFSWGVPVPNDPRHVMYVWFDALSNYMTALGGPAAPGEAPLFDQFWPPAGQTIHIVGKDILRFHAVYWPAFLLSAGIAPPTQVWAHGWLTVNGQKMSKSLGNFLSPAPLAEVFGVDVLRYYLMRDIAFGQDGDFAHANLIARLNGELANGLGNLLNRVLASIVQKNLGGKVPAPVPSARNAEDDTLEAEAVRCTRVAAEHLDNVAPQRSLEAIWELVAATNRYVDRSEPWALVKRGEQERLSQVVYQVLESLRMLGVMIAPFMPTKAAALRDQLGLPPLAASTGSDQWPGAWGQLPAGTQTRPGAALFPRLDKDGERAALQKLGIGEPAAAPAQPKAAAPKDNAPAEGGFIEYDDFAKVQLRVALVLSAERVPKSDKLLKLSLDAGDPAPRQIIAGIAQHYAPEALVGKRVVIVANLKPRKLMGLESQGMVLAASDDTGLVVATVAGEPKPGSLVK
ncbi:MAG TPA: methionine--tRNA ligase [Polyangiales bacterium]|nr:methionine--tRNA ligase [Polyangiales bacterium]